MKKNLIKRSSLFLVFFFVNSISAQFNPINLRCEFAESPYGIDVLQPVLSWTIKAAARGARQTAYQVLVASSLELLKADNGDLWNSGKIKSDNMGQIVYSGKTLQSSQQCWWKVKIWDENKKVSVWSTPSQWTMGILNYSDWKANWISASGAEKYASSYQSAGTDFNLKKELAEFRVKKPKPNDTNFSSMLLRNEFQSKPQLSRAVIHISGMGHYELTINGNKIGDHLLAPGWSDYKKTVLYDTYDITKQIKIGNNAIGLMLSNGMYNIQPDSIRYVKFLNSYGPLKAIAQLRIEYDDGTIQIIATDKTWQVTPGPVTYMNQFGGEDHDARLEPKAWNQPLFSTDKNWQTAIECTGPGGTLKGFSCSAPPIKAIETLSPIKKTQLKPNVWVYDLGQNVSIMPEIEVKGAVGSSVRIIPAELIDSKGFADRASATQNGVRPAWWQYTKATDGNEKWFPKFFYQGSRYLQVELYPAQDDTILPVVEKINAVVVHSSASHIGTFSCSNELFNRIYSLVRWAQRSNMMSVLTDCPQREKMGWLEQYHLNGPSLRYNFDLVNLFRKGMNDMSDGQWKNGFVPNIAPGFFYAGPLNINNGFFNSPEWGSSFIIVPWQQYLFSGDKSLIVDYYDKMKHYVAFLDSQAKDNILNVGLGDWYDIGPKPAWGSQLTPVSFTATAIYFYDNLIMSQMAKTIGKTADAKEFEQKAETIRQSFNKEFYNKEKGNYATGSHTTSALPLFFNIVEPQNRKALIDSLVIDIRKRGNSFTSGEVGYRFLLKALAMEGHSDVIYDMNNQTDKPGYGYQLKKGATSLTEKWDAEVGNMGSQNHFMSGQINEWFFHDLVGIGVAENGNGAGFRHSIIKPIIVGDLKWVKGSYQTVSGLITSEWKQNNGEFSLEVSIPANTTATVYVPAEKGSVILESGKPLSKTKGVKSVYIDNKSVIVEVESGNYHFVTK